MPADPGSASAPTRPPWLNSLVMGVPVAVTMRMPGAAARSGWADHKHVMGSLLEFSTWYEKLIVPSGPALIRRWNSYGSAAPAHDIVIDSSVTSSTSQGRDQSSPWSGNGRPAKELAGSAGYVHGPIVGKHSSQPLKSKSAKSPSTTGGRKGRCGSRQSHSRWLARDRNETIFAPHSGTISRSSRRDCRIQVSKPAYIDRRTAVVAPSNTGPE